MTPPDPSQLDRPVWNSLEGPQRDLSEGGSLARRYAPHINLFGSARDNSEAALTALKALFKPGQTLFILQVGSIHQPPGFEPLKAGPGVQMVAPRTVGAEDGADDIRRLSASDASAMLALATLTEPGPFLSHTHSMGRYWGIFRDGRLAAMAGERMRLEGYTEVSGVCTHPDAQGQGLARRLSAHVAGAIQARGETPFLHAWSTNTHAIKLYERLGFETRAEVNAMALKRV